MRSLHLFRTCLSGFSLIIAIAASSAAAQTTAPNEWTWMGGSDTFIVPENCSLNCVIPSGVYGTLGVPAASNYPGGRQSGATWTDKDGNLWLFGGYGYDSSNGIGDLNDLWKFNPSTLEWTWMGGGNLLPDGGYLGGLPGVYGTLGVPAAGNIPGGRESAATWVDNSGNLWLFGGEAYGEVNQLWGNYTLNDLWEFNPSTDEWAWMGGSNLPGQPGVYGSLKTPAPANIPGSRSGATSWTDKSGNLWLFGGGLNDLWEFNPSTNEWAWMSGSSGIDDNELDWGQAGVYGSLGVPASTNVPSGRSGATGWTDINGNFWLFGGQGYDSGISDPNNAGYLNDLWEFNPAINEWTWMGGSNTLPCNDVCGQYGVYGPEGIVAANSYPGGRENAISWTDGSGNFWMFGGVGSASTGPTGLLADLWQFSPSTNRWGWMGGSNSVGPCRPSLDCGWEGVYGSLGVPAAGNIPGTREMAQSWTDHAGNFWFFGGYGDDLIGDVGALNDFWIFQPPAGALPAAAAPVYSVSPSVYSSSQTVTISDATPGAIIYCTSDGKTVPSTSSLCNPSIDVTSSETLQAVALAPGFRFSAVSSATYTINLPPPDFSVVAPSPASMTVSPGQSGTASISIAPQNGFNSAVTFACAGLPSGASCSFSPATVTPSGAASSTTLTIATSATTAALRSNRHPLFPTALAAILFCLGIRKRRRLKALLLLTVCSISLALLNGCGGGSSSGSGGSNSQPVTSTITVTATSGPLQHTATISLTVN